MGDSSVAITYDLYGHLMPGSQAEAAALLDAYLETQRKAQEERARAAGADFTGAQTGAHLATESEKPHE
jgi:hypothetical protein